MEGKYPFSESSFIIEDKTSSSNNIFWATEGLNGLKNVQFCGADEDWGELEGINSLSSNFGLFADDPLEEERCLLCTNQQKCQHQPSYLEHGPLDNLQFDMVSPPLQTGLEDIMKFHDQHQTMVPVVEFTKDKQYSTPFASLELLKNYYGKGFKRLSDEENTMQPVDDDLAAVRNEVGRKLSTEEVMRMAGTRFIQSSSESAASLEYLVSHPFGFSFSGLSDEEKKDVELAESLLATAEKVGYQQYERARKFLSHCESLSSKTGSTVKRVVYYFAEALRLKIDRETGRVSSKDLETVSFDFEEEMKSLNPTILAIYEELPFCQVTMFAGVQAIIENVAEAKKIHLIDLGIRQGAQWTILMHALESRHECPVELLKITAVGSGAKSKQIIEDTDKRLKDYAERLNIPFSFNIVMVSDMLHLREDHFEIDPEETVAVFSNFALRDRLRQPEQLETIMRVIRTICPSVMVVSEIDANHNSKSFVNRFTEALFYFSAFFDCIETCMKKDDPNRMIIESKYFNHSIRNIVAAEGAERTTRHVKIDVWRAFFSRFGMVETKLSMSSLYQADLVAKRFPSGRFVTFDMNGDCLLIGWKGTPINTVSVWKFFDGTSKEINVNVSRY